jgi:pimeloyl-ACP methyl ester carboxylesterase
MAPVPTTVRLSNQLTLSFVDVGERRAKDALILLPGMSDSWRSYELVLSRLPSSIRTIAISQRGHGDSDKPPSNYAVRDFEADLVALLDVLGLRRVVVAGHSSASMVARRFALDHPERTAGLVLEGSFVALAGLVGGDVEARFAALTDPMPREFVRNFAAGTFARPPPAVFVDAMVDESLKVPARVWRETFASLAAYNDSRELAALRTPTLIVWGNRDAIINRDATDTLARSIQSSELLVYDDVGHTPHWEDPQRFSRDVAAFVERCGRPEGSGQE